MVAQPSKPEQQSDRQVSSLERHSLALESRLSTLEQENASLRCLLAQQSCSRLQSCERSHAVLQAEVAEYRRKQNEQTQQTLLQAEQARSAELERHNVELQQMLSQLAESEQRYRALFELSSEGIVRFGYKHPISLALPVDEQLEQCYESIYFAEANNEYAKMYDYEKLEDLIGRTLIELHDRNSDITQAAMRSWIENQYFCHQLETVELDRYGRKRYFLNSAISTIENNAVTSRWVSQIDITELRETQQALLETEQERSAELAKASK